jgi:ParB family chromosome partitioning protein
MASKKGQKFTAKYGVKTANIYRATDDTRSVKIPPLDHPLYDASAPTAFDPRRVAAIDRDGTMTDPIEVWTDPDSGILWVLDGRWRWLDVEEVNRRRRESGRDLVEPYLVPFPGDERAAVARVREKNYHRRVPPISTVAVDLLVLRKRGYSWAQCVDILHQDVGDPDRWGRGLLPLAHCIEEVRAAVDAGYLARGAARRFGGTAPDGSKALGRREQLALLDELLASGRSPGRQPRVASLGPRQRERVRDALTNGVSEHLKGLHRVVAEVVAATLARVGGDAKALKAWPEISSIVDEALKVQKKK